MSRFILTTGLAVLLSSVASQAQVTIVQGVPTNGLARSMNNNNNSIALTPDAAMWTVVYLTDSAGLAGHLELRRSTDQGKTWPNAYALPNNTSHNNHHNNSGCIVPGRGADELHVTWADKTANVLYWSAMYQVFNTQTLKWVGTPTLLAKGYSGNNQFWPVDITVTPKATVAVCVSGHRSGGLGLGSWDCGLAIKKPGGTFNATLINLRNGGQSYSQNACIVAVDEKIHCCMKNNLGLYGIAYRSYDTEKKAWDQTSQVMVGPNNNLNIAAGNKSVIATDTVGGLYVMYVTGNATQPRTLRVAYAAPGKGSINADWKDLEIIKNTATIGPNYRGISSTGSSGAYPQLRGGNSSYRNYSLSPSAGGVMTVVYSKAFETFTSLYFRQFKDGLSILPEIKISPSSSKPYSYEWVTGLRNGDFASLSTWLTFGKTDAPAPNNGTFPNGRVDFWKTGAGNARTISFGTGCQGQLTQRPRVHAHDSRPALGGGFKLNLDRFPGTANFFLAVGTQILNPPLNLAIMAAPTCELNINFPLIVGLQASSSGTLTIPWTVPNNNNLLGVSFFAQCLVIAPGSTPGNVVTTNALTLIFGN